MKPATAIDLAPRFDPARVSRLCDRYEAKAIDIGSASVQVKVASPEARGGFSLIEYVIEPRTLVAPLHRHTWEDEYSFVLEGRLAVLLGEEVSYAEPGELAFKPRRLWHTVWNPDDVACRVLEIISPGGFEQFFEELASERRRPAGGAERRGGLGDRYGVDSDFDSVPRLCAEHGLVYPRP